jgi:hypothetical protein
LIQLLTVNTLQEQGETLKGLEQAVEAGHRALEVERKQVEGESLFDSCFAGFLLEGSHPFLTSFLPGNFRLAHRFTCMDRGFAPLRGPIASRVPLLANA